MAIKKNNIIEKPERVMYLGPNILSVGLQKNQVFKGGKPVVLSELKEKYSLIEVLFANVENINVVNESIRQKGTQANLAYQQILNKGDK